MTLFKRKKRHFASVEITPLIDIVFLLLIFFMISSTFLRPTIKMKLPILASRGFNQQDKIVVSVDTGQKVYINNKLTSLANLTKDLSAIGPLASITFRADKKTDYGLIIMIMEKLKLAGIKNILLEHETRP